MNFTYDEQEFDKKWAVALITHINLAKQLSLNTQTAQTYFYLRMKTLS